MGDDFEPANGVVMFREVGGEWESLGYVGADGISFDSGESEVWQGRLPEMSQPVTVHLKPCWWSLNRLYKLVFGRAKYTVPRLRRENKGHRRNKW